MSSFDRCVLKVYYGSFGQYRLKKGQVLSIVSCDEKYVEVTDNGESRFCFLRREVECLPLSSGEIEKSGKRYWRVSAFRVGFNGLADACEVHKRSRSSEIAQQHYLRLCRGVGTKYGAVFLHKGNLKGNGHTIYLAKKANSEVP